MVEAEGMGLAPWGTIGRGWLKSREEYQRADREGRKMADQPEKYARIAGKLEEIANRKGKNTLITSVALAYVMHKVPYVFPIIGGRKVDHLKGNIDALGIKLSQEEIDEIDSVEPFDVGFPMNFLFGYGDRQYKTSMGPNDIQMINTNARIETVPKVQVSCEGGYLLESGDSDWNGSLSNRNRARRNSKVEKYQNSSLVAHVRSKTNQLGRPRFVQRLWRLLWRCTVLYGVRKWRDNVIDYRA